MKHYLPFFFVILFANCLFAQDLQNDKLFNPHPLLNDFMVERTDNFSQPRIGVDKNENFIIVWIDSSDTQSKIMCNKYTAEGIRKARKALLSCDSSTKITSLKLSVHNDGSFCIVWISNKNDCSSIYFREFNKLLSPLSKVIQVNDKFLTEAKYPNIAFSSLGYKVVTWTNWYKGKPKIYAKKYDEKNLSIGSAFTVADNYKLYNQYQSSVAFYTPENFIVAWNDNREGYYNEHIFAQNYDFNDKKIGDNYKVSWYRNSFFPIVTSSENGNYAIVWSCYLFKYPKIIAQLINERRKFISSNFHVNSNKNFCLWDVSACMNYNGELVIAWNYYGNNHNIYEKYFSSYGKQLSSCYCITNLQSNQCAYPEVYFKNNKLYHVWINNSKVLNTNGVWANILTYQDSNETTGILNKASLTNFTLSQNYPNPFNPNTTIKYSIPSQSVITRSKTTWQSHSEITSSSQQDGISRNSEVNVTLKVYDILGREVTTLINQKQKPGYYEVTWDASHQPSGVYFYQLKAGNYVETKKMILMR